VLYFDSIGTVRWIICSDNGQKTRFFFVVVFKDVQIFGAWRRGRMYLLTVVPDTTDMRRLTTGIRSKKCVIRLFRRCANVYLTLYLLTWRILGGSNDASKSQMGFNSAFKGLNLDSIAYYTPRLYGIAYCY
jgi:hypothetical protein